MVCRVFYGVDIDIGAFFGGNGKHIVEIDDGIVFYFNKVKTFLHCVVFGFEGG